MKKGHLHLVVSDGVYCTKRAMFTRFKQHVHDWFKCIITSRREKIYMLKDSLMNIYRDYELSTGFAEIPYYVRAEVKISKIIQEGKVDYYYNLFSKFRKK